MLNSNSNVRVGLFVLTTTFLSPLPCFAQAPESGSFFRDPNEKLELKSQKVSHPDPKTVVALLEKFFPYGEFDADLASGTLYFRATSNDMDQILKLLDKIEADGRMAAATKEEQEEEVTVARATFFNQLAETAENASDPGIGATSPEEAFKIFRNQQKLLRQQVDQLKAKLEILEKRLEKREKFFQEKFGILDAQMPKLAVRNLNLNAVAEQPALPKQPPQPRQPIAAVQNQWAAEAPVNVANVPQGPAQPEPVWQNQNEPAEENKFKDAEAGVEPEVEEAIQGNAERPKLEKPIEAEEGYAAAIQRYGGYYELNDEGKIESVNMVYHEQNGTRYDNPQVNKDNALKYLPKLKSLKSLYLRDGQVSDQSMRFVLECKNLEVFFVWDARKLTDEGAAQLSQLKKLKKIHISGAGLTDLSLEAFSELPDIERLSLQQNSFGDKGLEALTECKKLVSVWVGLGHSKFSDSAIRKLADVESLKELEFQNSPISKTTLTAFKDSGVKLIHPIVN